MALIDATRNSRGGIDRLSNREIESGLTGMTGTGSGTVAVGGTGTTTTTNPYTMEEFSRDLSSGALTSQSQLDAIIADRGWSGNTTQNRVSGASSTPLGSTSGSGSGGTGTSNPPVGGGSDGSNFGSVGSNYNPGGATRFDSAGNVLLGTDSRGRNIIDGRRGIDRTAGVATDPMTAWSQFTDPNYFMGRAEDVRKQVERSMQGTIDAINQRYEGQVRREEQAGQEDLARQRSMNLRAGLGGSDFGAANKAEVRNRTSANVRDIQANQDIAVGNAIMQIEQVAQNRIQMEQTAMQNAFSNTVAMQGLKMQMQTQAKESIKELGAAGLDMETIKAKDPALYQSITSAAGIGEVQAEYLMNTARKAAEKVDYTWQVVGNKILGYGVDPKTGELKQVQQDLAVEVPKNYGVSFAPDGTMIMVPDQFDPNIPASQQVIFGGNFAKPETGGEYGLSATEASIFNSIANKYASSPLIQASDRAVILKDTIARLRENPTDPALQLSLVYSYVQALDTYQSAVREGELALVQSLQSKISGVQNAVERVNNGQIVNEKTILNIADAGEALVTSVNSAAQRKANAYKSQAEAVGVGEAWNAFMGGFEPNYTVGVQGGAGVDETDPEVQAAQTAPVGSIVYLNGKPYKKLGEDNFQELSSISAPK